MPDALTKVMVTGGAGFVGKRVVQRLQLAGATDIFVPLHSEFDLRDRAGLVQVVVNPATSGLRLAQRHSRSVFPTGRACTGSPRRYRCKSSASASALA